MTECLCPQCAKTPAPTFTEAWRHECEARHLLDGIPNGEERAKYLDGVERSRGATERRRLVETAREIRDQRRGIAA